MLNGDSDERTRELTETFLRELHALFGLYQAKAYMYAEDQGRKVGTLLVELIRSCKGEGDGRVEQS